MKLSKRARRSLRVKVNRVRRGLRVGTYERVHACAWFVDRAGKVVLTDRERSYLGEP